MYRRRTTKLGQPLKAYYAKTAPEFPGASKPTMAQQAGINYEKAVIKKLVRLYEKVEPHPWITFNAANASGICQPDALVWLNAEHILLVEIKLSHVREARTKLMHFYKPLVEYLHPNKTVTCLQIYKNVRRYAHKNALNIYSLEEKVKKGKYSECHFVG
jgi:hypothetical protein